MTPPSLTDLFAPHSEYRVEPVHSIHAYSVARWTGPNGHWGHAYNFEAFDYETMMHWSNWVKDVYLPELVRTQQCVGDVYDFRPSSLKTFNLHAVTRTMTTGLHEGVRNVRIVGVFGPRVGSLRQTLLTIARATARISVRFIGEREFGAQLGWLRWEE